MNRRKIIQLVLASATFASGASLHGNEVKAAEVSTNIIHDQEMVWQINDYYEGKVINVDTNLRIREDASLNSKVIGYLTKDQTCNIKGETDEWYRIDFNGNEGYVSKEYVEVITDSQRVRSIQKGQVFGTGVGLNLRQSASTKAAIISTLKDGDIIEVISKSSDWYNVRSGTKVGFVSAKYVKLISETSNSTNNSTNTSIEKGKVNNISSNLRVREKASANSLTIGYFLSGQEVEILGESGEWYKVNYKGKTGYSSKQYITKISSGNNSNSSGSNNAETTINKKGEVYNTGSSLRVRSTASTSSSILGSLKDGTSVDIISSQGNWYKIKYASGYGYVSKEYVKIKENTPEKPSETPSPEVSESKKGEVYNTGSSLRVRSTASTSSSILGSLKDGTSVDIISSQGDWYKIKYASGYGYISKEYVKIKENTPEKPSETPSPEVSESKRGEVYNTGSNLRVREKANVSSQVLGYLVDGTKVDIQGTEGDWYRIKYNSKIGYVSKSYVRIINDTNTKPETPTEKPEQGESNEENKVVLSLGSVSTSSLNVRSGAGKDFGIIGSIKINDIVEVVDKSSQGWYKIKYKDGFGYVSNHYINISTNSSNYSKSLDEYVNLQYPKLNLIQKNGLWVNASKDEIQYNLDSNNFIGNDSKYMFMKLNHVDGISMSVINEVIQGRGILSGKGQAFLDGAKKYNVNVMYLLSHARLETGNGTSTLSKGVLVKEVDGVPVTPKVVYNMYGVGAIDSDPLRGGAEYAYKQGWFTPEIAITEGAHWISNNYINNSTYKQNTLYKMRWNISSSGMGWHQYASDIAWAEKQAKIMAPYLEKCKVAFEFDIPTFKK